MTAFFTSDHHFGHANIIKYCNRPFESVPGMNEIMVFKWNKVVAPEDTVYYLGDFSMNKASMALYLPRLNGTKHLIMGNHDACHPVHKAKGEAAKQFYLDSGFASISLEKELVIGGMIVLLHHLPYTGDHTIKERYTEFRPKDTGKWLLHGHVHDKWLMKPRQLNVGVDQHDFYPISMEQVLQFMLTQRIH